MDLLMNRLYRSSLAVAALLAISSAHADPLNTGSYVLGSELSSPGSFVAQVNAAAAGSATLSFELAGFASLDGAGNCCTDIFHLSVNGAEVFTGTFNLGGGGSNTVYFNPYGAVVSTTTFGASDDVHNSNQVTWSGGITSITLPVELLAGANSLSFAYTGGAQGLGDEGWGVNSASITAAAVPEPETYALMLAGLGAVGVVARRRKANSAR
jgi:hypothetical protein